MNDELPPGAEVILGNPYAPQRPSRQRTASPEAETIGPKGNKYSAQRIWSELCKRTFDSKAEARRGEELHLLQLAGQINGLEYQPKWVLCEDKGHKASYSADFKYTQDGVQMIEDVKGMDTEASRVRRAWLWSKYGIDVNVIKSERR